MSTYNHPRSPETLRYVPPEVRENMEERRHKIQKGIYLLETSLSDVIRTSIPLKVEVDQNYYSAFKEQPSTVVEPQPVVPERTSLDDDESARIEQLMQKVAESYVQKAA